MPYGEKEINIMMLHPSYVDMMDAVNSDAPEGEEIVQSRYSIVMASAKRARQIVSGDKPLTENKDKKPKTSVAWYDWILAIVSTIPGFFIMFNYNEIVERMAGVDEVTMIQLVLGTIIILTLIEATRRAVGFPIILVSLAFMSYCMYYQMTDIATQNGLTSISENFWLCFKEAYKQLVEEM